MFVKTPQTVNFTHIVHSSGAKVCQEAAIEFLVSTNNSKSINIYLTHEHRKGVKPWMHVP